VKLLLCACWTLTLYNCYFVLTYWSCIWYTLVTIFVIKSWTRHCVCTSVIATLQSWLAVISSSPTLCWVVPAWDPRIIQMLLFDLETRCRMQFFASLLKILVKTSEMETIYDGCRWIIWKERKNNNFGMVLKTLGENGAFFSLLAIAPVLTMFSRCIIWCITILMN